MCSSSEFIPFIEYVPTCRNSKGTGKEKKGGAGGKFSWLGSDPMSNEDADVSLDRNDPNYNSQVGPYSLVFASERKPQQIWCLRACHHPHHLPLSSCLVWWGSWVQETDSDLEHDLYKLSVAEFKASVTELLKEYLSTGSLEGACVRACERASVRACERASVTRDA